MKTNQQISDEFDKIAIKLETKPPKKNFTEKYFIYPYNQIPEKCDYVLDIGCGLGDFVRYMALRSKHALGIDLSPEMIRVAREHSKNIPNVEFQIADILEYELPHEHFDCIASFMTLHHLPLSEVFVKIKATLKPNGVLIVKDECQPTGLVNVFLHKLNSIIKQTSGFMSGKKRKTRWEHDPNEKIPLFKDVVKIASEILPGATIKLANNKERYSLFWKKT